MAMGKEPQVFDRGQAEAAINQIQGVVASRIVPDPQGGIAEVHVMASTKRPAKKIVRDIESLLFVRFGLKMDYRRVSLVQLGEEQILPLGISRIKLLSVNWEEEPPEVRAQVKIQSPQGTYIGSASSADHGVPRPQLAAQATLQALQQVVGKRAELALGQVEEFPLGERRVLLVQVSYLFPAGEENLLGVSFVGQGGGLEAAARAALDAVNRRLPVITLT